MIPAATTGGAVQWLPVRYGTVQWLQVTVTVAEPSPEARICSTATTPPRWNPDARRG